MFGFKKKNDEAKKDLKNNTLRETIKAPVKGRLIPLSQVKDDVFSSGMLGPGAAVIPEDHTITAPCAGTVETVFPTGHAYGIKTESGLEILIHIGIDTVELEGKGFSPAVKQGDHVNPGDALGSADLDLIIKSGYDPVIIIVASSLPDGHILSEAEEKPVSAGDTIMEVLRS